MSKKKEELLDFGVFGVWSKETLMAQSEFCFSDCECPKFIEEEHNKHWKEYITLRNKRYFFPKMKNHYTPYSFAVG